MKHPAVLTSLIDTLQTDALADHTRHSFDLEVAPLADGSMLRIPVNVVAGSGLRPRVVLVAGIHGDESEGIVALTELWESIDPRNVTGRLIIVPVANPPAFAAGTRRSPIDGLDLNRVFPGSRIGTVSEQLAHVLFRNTIVGSDLLFSLHSWYSNGIVLPYIEVFDTPSPAVIASYRAAIASGFDTVRVADWPLGLLTRAANEAGVIGIEAEVGGMGTSTQDGRQIYRARIEAVLGHVGMLHDSEHATHAEVAFVRRTHVFAPVGGLLRLRITLGDVVQEGDALGAIHDLHGNAIATVPAPHAGRVAALRTFASVAPGDHVCALFRPVVAPDFVRP